MAAPRIGDHDLMGRYPVSMLNSFPVLLIVGAALGFLSGLGIGGGSLLVVWLTMVLNTDPLTARGVNLLFFIPSAVVAILIRCKEKKFHLRSVLPAIAAGCVAAAVFSWISTVLDVVLLKKLFGGILIAAGIRELLYRPRNAR